MNDRFHIEGVSSPWETLRGEAVKRPLSEETPPDFDKLIPTPGLNPAASEVVMQVPQGPAPIIGPCGVNPSSIKNWFGRMQEPDVTIEPSPAQAEELRAAVEQRYKALLAWLRDFYTEKIFETKSFIPAPALGRIYQRAEGIDAVRGEAIRFNIGPYIGKGPQGTFVFVDDNPAFVGGVGEGAKAMKTVFHQRSDRFATTQALYADLAKRFREQVRGGGQEVVLLRYERTTGSEETRLANLYRQQGIETVYMKRDALDEGYRGNHLDVATDGLYLVTSNGDRKKVGFIIMDLKPGQIDLNCEMTIRSNIDAFSAEVVMRSDRDIWESLRKGSPREALASLYEKRDAFTRAYQAYPRDYKELTRLLGQYEPSLLRASRNDGLPGILNAFYRGQVGMTQSPGTGMIGDKELYPYVDDMIRFYLKQEPLKPGIPTQSFAVSAQEEVALDQKVYDLVFGPRAENKNYFVIKKVNGRGRDGVWVGAQMRRRDFAALSELVRQNPDLYVVQLRAFPLEVDGKEATMRLLADVRPERIKVAEKPWITVANYTGEMEYAPGMESIRPEWVYQPHHVVISPGVGSPFHGQKSYMERGLRKPARRDLSNAKEYTRHGMTKK